MRKGFTLVELLVVISIIGVLSSIVLSTVDDARKIAQDNRELQAAGQLQLAIELFINENNRYPTPGSVTLGGTIIGGNCLGGDGLTTSALTQYRNNWDEFAAEMGDRLPDIYREYTPWPFCFFYYHNYSPCDSGYSGDSRYGILFTTHNDSANTPYSFSQTTPAGNDVERNCLFSQS